jgi:hypothetical protein
VFWDPAASPSNLHGVTSPYFFGNRTAEREAGVWESLGRLPAAERPTHLITTVATQDSFPTLREIALPPPLFQTNSFLDEILIYRMRYDLVGKNGRMFLPESLQAVSGLREADRLNVCDAADEAAHAYRFESRLGNLRLNGTARIDRYAADAGEAEVVVDGGRAILGRESFRVRTRKDADLVVVMRTASSVNANVMRASGSGQFGVEITDSAYVAVNMKIMTRMGRDAVDTRGEHHAAGNEYEDEPDVRPVAIDAERQRGNLSSAIRLFVLDFYRGKQPKAVVTSGHRTGST